MKKKNIPKTVDNNELRLKAVNLLKQKKKDSKAAAAKEDLATLVQELQVHQIELEIQNEELIRVNSENEELKNKYFELYDLAPSGYFTLDDKGKILELNLTAAKFFNKEKSSLTGYNFINFIDPSDKKDFINFINEAFITRSMQTSVFKMKKGLQYFQIDGIPIESPENKFNKLWMTAVDITNNILLEKELTKRENDAKYHTLFNTMTEGFVLCELIYDADGNTIDYRFLELNNSFERLLTGLISQKIIGRLASEVATLNEIFDIKKYSKISPSSGYVYFETHSKSLNKDYEVSAYCPESGKLAILFNDITDRKQSEEKLRESEKRLSAVFNGVSETLMLADIEGNIIAANNLAISRLNKGKPDIAGKNLYDLLPARFHEPRKEQLRELINTKKPVKFQDEFNDAFLELYFYPITDIKGDVIQFVSFALDITERKKAEDDLQTALQRFYLILSNMHFGILLVTADDRIEFTNQAFCDTFGLKDSPADLLNLSAGEMIEKIKPAYINPDSAVERIREIVSLGQPVRGEDVGMRGERAYLRDFIPIRIGDNQYGRLWIHMDITDRKRIEEALLESEQRLKFHFENSPLAVIEWDSNFIVTQWSSEAERIFGWKKEETIGKRIDALKMIYDEDIPIVNHTMERLTSGKEPVVVSSNRNFTKSGAVIECVWYNSILLDHNGVMSSVMSLVQDITERKKAETEIIKAKEAAENASKVKSEFIANVSHELRTPLNAVLGYAQLLKKSDNLSEKQRTGIDVIYNSGNHLLNLINDILDISKLEAGKMNLEKISFNLPDFLKNIAEIINIQIMEKKITFKLDIKSDMPVYITGDQTKLNQVLFNLLSNAVKFTEKGKVILHVQLIKADKKNIPPDRNKFRFEIIDTGIGIPEDKLKVIFDSFQQLNIKNSKSKGAGLGLAICRNLVKLMGSELYVKSKVGEGSTFWFDFDFDALYDKYMPVDFKSSIKNPEADSEKDNFAVPSSDDLKTLYSFAKIGDIINIRKYIEKIEIENPELIPFASRLKLLAKNINLSEIEALLKKYIKE